MTGFSFSEFVCYSPFKHGFETVCGPILRRTHCWKLNVYIVSDVYGPDITVPVDWA